MKEWTREERYRTILEASNEELTELRDIVNSCPYRQKFHIQPTTGLLNDPNGFSYYNNECNKKNKQKIIITIYVFGQY